MLLNSFSISVLTFSLYLTILYKSTASCALFCLLVISILWGFIHLLCLPRKLKFWMPDTILEVGNKEHMTFTFHVENTGFLSLTYARAKIWIVDAAGNKSRIRDLCFSVGNRQQTSFTGELSSKYCGRYVLQIDSIRLYSPGHLLSRKIRPKLSTEALFYPPLHPVSMTISEAVRYFPAESDGFDEILSGSAHVPMNQFRVFQPGDKIRQVHWKLSARTDDLLVRESGKPDGFPVLLFLHLKLSDSKTFKARYSSFLQYAASLSFCLLEARCPHFVVWYHHKEQSIIRFPIRSEEDLNLCLYYLMHEKITKADNTLDELYTHKYPSDTCQTKLTLTTELELYKNHTLLLSCTKDNWLEQIQNYSLTV